MMKKTYTKPRLEVIEIQTTHLICGSGVDVIPPGQPNQPAGARDFDLEDWDE